MLNCRQITRLVSRSMDSRLAWHQRLAIRVHLLYCVWCRRYAAQLQFVRKAARELAPEPAEAAARTLSAEAKTEMRRRLQDALKNRPGSSQ
jgi:Putative zinc-finger